MTTCSVTFLDRFSMSAAAPAAPAAVAAVAAAAAPAEAPAVAPAEPPAEAPAAGTEATGADVAAAPAAGTEAAGADVAAAGADCSIDARSFFNWSRASTFILTTALSALVAFSWRT